MYISKYYAIIHKRMENLTGLIAKRLVRRSRATCAPDKYC